MKKLFLMVMPIFFTGCVYYTDTIAYRNRDYYVYEPSYYTPNYYAPYNYYFPKKDYGYGHSHHHEKKNSWHHYR